MVKKKKKNILFLPAKFSRILIFGFALFVILGVVIICVEIGCTILFFLSRGGIYSRQALQKRLDTVLVLDTIPATEIVANDVRDFVSGYVPHPYVGFVEDPKGKIEINTYGWLGPLPVTKRSDDTVVIAIFGGSVAELFYRYHLESFLSLLRKSPVFYGKYIKVINTALGGYKQPQQLLALEYLLAQGAEYDIVVNIDGFNEVTLPGTDNYSQKVAPIFPRSWNWYAQTLQNSQTVYQVALLYFYHDIRKCVASIFSFYPFRQFMITLLLWNGIDGRINYFAQREVSALRSIASSEKNTSFRFTGPSNESMTPETLTDYAVSIWRNSSLQMNKISMSNGMLYIHVLQPDLYYAGSKILTPTEKKRAPVVDTPDNGSYQQLAQQGYPKLVQIGRDDLRYQERFVDLTQLFVHERENIYLDNSHYNEKGNTLFAEAIAKEVISLYEARNRW